MYRMIKPDSVLNKGRGPPMLAGFPRGFACGEKRALSVCLSIIR